VIPVDVYVPGCAAAAEALDGVSSPRGVGAKHKNEGRPAKYGQPLPSRRKSQRARKSSLAKDRRPVRAEIYNDEIAALQQTLEECRTTLNGAIYIKP